nr:phosphotransferase [Desulfobacula sp.]
MLAKQQSAFTEMEKDSIHKVSETLQGKSPIPFLIIHGDFAPWNLKRLTNDEITAIDWEDSDLNGLPLWDLSHFFCIQAHLFGGPNPFKEILESPLVALYMKRIGLAQNNIKQFYTLYLIKKFIGSGLFSTNSYGAFLIQQIHRISRQ